MRDIHENDQEWKALLAALKFPKATPLAEYKILQLATARILELEARLEDEHRECVKAAREVIPPEQMHLHYAHQVAWGLVSEIKKMKEEKTK